MSAWRLALQQLHQAGGSALPHDFGDEGGRCQLARMGLAVSPGRFVTDQPWRITPMGVEVAEGRLQRIVRRQAPSRWAATWLRALPVGVSLNA
jgi:hypothetical protein